jgi:hypothetical protein
MQRGTDLSLNQARVWQALLEDVLLSSSPASCGDFLWIETAHKVAHVVKADFQRCLGIFIPTNHHHASRRTQASSGIRAL